MILTYHGGSDVLYVAFVARECHYTGSCIYNGRINDYTTDMLELIWIASSQVGPRLLRERWSRPLLSCCFVHLCDAVHDQCCRRRLFK